MNTLRILFHFFLDKFNILKILNFEIGIEIEQTGSNRNCRLGRADFVSLQKQLNLEKNAEIKRKLEESGGLPDLSLLNIGETEMDVISRQDSISSSIQFLSRSTANAMRQLFDQKEKQASW